MATKKQSNKPKALTFDIEHAKTFTFSKSEPIHFVARNAKQQDGWDTIISGNEKVIFLVGAVGSGKTTVGVLPALELLRKDKTIRRIVLLRPVTTSKSEQLGFLKGGLEEKIAPLLLPLQDVIEEAIGEDGFASLVESKKIVPFAINFIEGRTYKKTIVLVDEFQNIDSETLRSILTRIDDTSKVIIMGDKKQIKMQDPSKSSAHDIERFRDKKGIKFIEFNKSEIVRGKVTKLIESCYDDTDLEKIFNVCTSKLYDDLNVSGF